MKNLRYYFGAILTIMLFCNSMSAKEVIVADFSNKKLPSSYWQTDNTAYITDRYGESAPSLQIKGEGYLMTNKIANLNEISFLCTRSNGGTNFKVQYSTNTIDFYDIATYTKDDIDKYNSAVGLNAITISDFSGIDSSNGVFIRFYSEKSSYYIDDIVITYGEENVSTKSSQPIFNPSDGTVFGDEGLNVTLSAAEGASIYYNINSDVEPTEETGILYQEGIYITETSTLKAIAVEEGKQASDVAVARYEYFVPRDESTAIFYVENGQELPSAGHSYVFPTGSDSSSKSLCGVKDMIAGDIQVEFTKGISSYTYSDGDKVRFYKESTLRLTPFNNATIKRVELRRKGESGKYTLLSSKGEITNNDTKSGSLNAWEGLTDSYIMLSNDGQIRFDYILVTYEPEKLVVTLEKPVIKVVEGVADSKNSFDGPIKVAVECPTPEAVVEYRFDEVSEWIAYTEPITIDKTTTIYAKASLSGITEETSAMFRHFKSQVSSIDEFRTYGPQEESVLSEDRELSDAKETFTFQCPLYVAAQRGERLFVIDKSDNFHNGLLIILNGNAADDVSFSRGDIIPAGTKGYYVNTKGFLPQLFINDYDATIDGNTADVQCYLPEIDGTISLTPTNVNVEDILLAKTDGDYRFMSKFVCASYSWFDLDNMTISIPVEDSEPSDGYAPQRALTAGDVTVDIFNLFKIELPSQSGLASITGILDYSEESDNIVYIPLGFGIATSIGSVEIADKIKVEGRNIIVPEGAEIYTLSGIKTEPRNLVPGIYIVRTSAGITKVLIP